MDDENIKIAVGALKKLEPGFLPLPIFEQVARLVTLPIVEIIPLRRTGGQTEVLLIERPANDRHWPNKLHTPGSVVRATDLSADGDNQLALERILQDELKNTEVSSPHYIGSLFHKSKRGTEQAQLYWVEVLGEPRVGQFYPVEHLPEALIESQHDFIQRAAQNFS